MDLEAVLEIAVLSESGQRARVEAAGFPVIGMALVEGFRLTIEVAAGGEVSLVSLLP